MTDSPRYAIFGPDTAFRRLVSSESFALAADETAVFDPPRSVGPGWRVAGGGLVDPNAAAQIPDDPTLSDWRVGLTLWKRPDGTLRIDEVTQKVADLVAKGHPMGRIARERLEYANSVLRAQLMQLKDALGFSESEVDESLWRADRVRQGDITGIWPLV